MIPLASYRPKKLDELNSFYDKTLSSQNVIESTASSISEDAFKNEPVVTAQAIDDFFAEQNDSSTGACADLTADISNFIANFGKPATAEDEIAIRRKPVVPIKIRNAPTPPKPVKFSQEPDEAPEQTAKAAPAPVEEPVQASEASAPQQESKPQKAEFVITAEKNELFEEYMRIMSDEDDDSDYSKSKSSRKRKKAKKAAEAKSEIKTASPSDEEGAYEAPSFTSELTADSTDEEADSFISFANGNEKRASAEEGKPDIITDAQSGDNDYDIFEAEEESPGQEKPRKNTALQLILFLLLFVTLLSAFAVTAVKTTLKVNSGELFADKYYIYTADFTDEVADIYEGDLILVENTVAQDGEVFVYESHGSIAFAVQTSSVEPQRTTGKNSTNDKITVMNSSIKGKVDKCYPSLGKLALTVTESFMTVIVSLLVIAVFIILLLIFAFRHTPKKEKKSSDSKKSVKDNFSFDEQEDMDEATDEDFSLT